MKTPKKLVTFLFILIPAMIMGSSEFQIKIVPEIISGEISYLQQQSFENVFIRDHFFYFLEDEKRYSEKEIQEFRKHFDYPSFNLFYFKNNKLVRHFYLITNQKKIKEGFYQVEFQVINTVKKATFCLYEIEVTRIKPLDFELKVIEEKVKKVLFSNRKAIVKTDLSKLRQSQPNTVKIQLPENLFYFNSDIEAMNELEFIGQYHLHFIFRFKLANADNKKAREEDHVARAYFCYIDFDSKNNSSVVYLTIVGFAIYIK